MIDRTQDEIMQNWGVDNTESPLVSVICCTYNHEKYIEEAINGFLMQETTFPFEVLINDDASTDNTIQILKKYEKKYQKIVKVFYHEKNEYSQGIDVFANVSTKANGKYIAICEGDDYWIDENKLQMQIDFLEKNSNYSMCFHKSKIQNELGLPCLLNCSDIEDRDYNPNELFEKWIVPTASMVFKREILSVHNKEIHKPLNGDIVLVLNCAKVGKIRGIAKEMAVYRMQESGVTYNEKLHQQRLLRYPEHFKFIKDNFKFIKRKTLNRSIIYSYLRLWRIDKKFKWILNAFFTSPINFVLIILFFPIKRIYKKVNKTQSKNNDVL